MGDIADDHIDAMMGYGRWSRGRYTPPPPTAACKLCGATNLKWRIADGGRWVLVENTRVQPGNFKPDHTCPTSAEGFDEV